MVTATGRFRLIISTYPPAGDGVEHLTGLAAGS
jgi:hypothetical protein